jgi:very-short-patch-repair endonuclease
MVQELDSKVRGAYEALRKKLIQTTLRNRMINYKLSAKAAMGLDIQDERSLHCWKVLLTDRKKMGFTGPADPAKRSKSDAPEFEEELQPNERVVNDESDSLLFTNVPKTKRETRLVTTYRAAVEQFEERGVNTLFLALGMLEWKAPEEEATHRAPLILVPVTLERTGRGDFKVVYDEGEIGTNLSLQVKLDEFGIKLPSLPSELEAIDPAAYFQEVAQMVKERDGFAVHPDEIALNFFAFEKIALYLDQDLRRWPEEQTPCHDADIVAALGSGYPPMSSEFSEDTRLDEVRSVNDAREVFQADSSQLLVLEEAKRGTSMVVEGPPGTGKSQTIANLIAEFVSQGKKVLFVSEKMAALEVVYRKLGEAGLADCALELHGAKSVRRRFFDEIRKTWRLRSRLPDETLRLERLADIRQKLNRYVEELHTPLEPYGVSPRRLLVLSSSLPPSDEIDTRSGYDTEALKEISWDEMQRHRPMLQTLQARSRELGVPTLHPFWASELEFFGPDERSEVDRTLGRLLSTGNTLTERAKNLAERLGVPQAQILADVAVLYRCVEVAAAAPLRNGTKLRVGSWRQSEKLVREVIEALRIRREVIGRRQSELSPLAWTQDWNQVRASIVERADSFFGRLGGDYKRAVGAIRAQLTRPDKLTTEAAKALSMDLFTVQGQLAVIVPRDSQMQALFGAQWEGLDSDPEHLNGVLEWVLKLEADIEQGRLPAAFGSLFEGNLDSVALQEASAQLRQTDEQFRAQVQTVTTQLRVEVLSLEKQPIATILTIGQNWQGQLDRVRSLISWKQLAKEARAAGLSAVVDLAEKWESAGERLENHVLWAWSRAAIRSAMFARPSLHSFERSTHEEMVSEFRRLDEEVLAHNRARVKHAHLSRLPEAGTLGGTGELARQCELKRGHKSIRWAVEKFGEILLGIKPVFMMSPLSVATYLPQRPGLFDVVIFDEASQVRPEDALSAISRAKQTIVVGDTKQMPPTNFFDSLTQDEEDDEDAAYDQAVSKQESVLALWSSVAGPVQLRDLRWHYRSLHDSLIQTSNRLFYGDRLVVFPSPVFEPKQTGSSLGLRFHYDPNTTYDRGAVKKVNRLQAQAVAEAMVTHMQERPTESLLVVAFNKHQQTAIVDALEAVCPVDLLQEFMDSHPHEPLKVKNLETVQGDERDVVYISIGYGKDSGGALTMNFGPLNRDGGERRLNVLITRAKRRTEVFTSIRGGEILVDEKSEGGVRALKVFLEFAETGRMNDARSLSDEADSEFEVQVRSALESKGYQLDGQVGTAGFRIDLAVRHPQRPGEYVLGIECDGASYHSAKSARDRDKLRQMVLESRGWRIHRIWSTDWWMNRAEAISRCVAAIEDAITNSDQPRLAPRPVEPVDQPAELEVWTDAEGRSDLVAEPYVEWDGLIYLAGVHLHEISPIALGGYIRQIVNVEAPIHVEGMITRLRMAAGLQRAGNRIREALDFGTAYATGQGWVQKRGEFLYHPEQSTIKPRNRAKLPAAESAIERISPEEIDAAIREVLDHAHFASDEDIFVGVRKLLGYGAMPNALREVVGDRLDVLLNEGTLRISDERYRLA